MTHTEFKQAIEDRITSWFDEKKKSAPTDDAKDLVGKIQTLVQRGGKRSRPELMYLTYVAYGGDKPEEIVDLGVALELFHQFLLVHDDIMDGDTVRYGGPNIEGMYLLDGSEIAQSMGILAGDLLFTHANQLILGSVLPEKTKLTLLQELHTINTDEMFGQQLDIFNVLENIDSFSEEKLALIHELKTSRYTTQLPMAAAAIVLGVSDDERAVIDEFARLFGIAFQLGDDYSDYFTSEGAYHAQKYRDFRSGKMSHPIFLGLTKSDDAESELVRRSFGRRDVTEKEIAKVLQILEKCRAKEESRRLAQLYHDGAKEALDVLAMDAQAKTTLEHLLDRFRV